MMQISQTAAATNINVVDSSLADFYNVIARLSQIPFVRITGKEDEADSIDWSFTYRKRKFTIQYSIYNGISLFSNEEKIEKLINKLATKLRLL